MEKNSSLENELDSLVEVRWEYEKMNQVIEWILSHKKKVAIFVVVFLVISLGGIIPKVPDYIEMYKNVQRAQISLLNDDLEGALVSYEKAYEHVPTKELSADIEQVKILITSKSSFIKAQKSEENENYESAYYYYQQVLAEDKIRYGEAQEKIVEMANAIVDSIYVEVEELYQNKLYLMIIGKLEHALNYGVKIEETKEKIDEYQQILFYYYMKRAEQEAVTHFNHNLFYNLFMKSLAEAEKYGFTEEMVTQYEQLKEELVQTSVTKYYELAMQAYQSSNQEDLNHYYQIIIELAPNSEAGKELQQLIEG